MESQTANVEREIPLQMEKIHVFTASYMKSLESVWARSQETAQYQVQLQQVKDQLREAEAELVKTLAALAASGGKLKESIEHIDETQEAISWYNRVLGLHVEGGRVLSCEPSLEGTKELIHELNKTNGLFTFVRVMRKKFQEAVAQGRLGLTTDEPEESAFISASAPVLPMLSVRSDSLTKENEHQVETTGGYTHIKKQNVRKRKNQQFYLLDLRHLFAGLLV